MLVASLPLFLVSLAMFYGWRLWLRLQGKRWTPTGRVDSPTAASQRYTEQWLREHPRTRRDKMWRAAGIALGLMSGVPFYYLLFTHHR